MTSRFPRQTFKKLRDAVPQEAAGQGMISEQGLKDMLLQSSPPLSRRSRSNRARPGRASHPRCPSRLGTLMMDQVFTFQGPDPKTPKLLLVGMEARVTLEPAENVTAKIRTQEGKGSLTFDPRPAASSTAATTRRWKWSSPIDGPGHRPDRPNDLDDDTRA